MYYDYGSGGNCYAEDGTVYYDGEPVATEEEFAEQAIGLADTGAQTIDAAIAADTDIEWMPLGVFALVHESQGDPRCTCSCRSPRTARSAAPISTR